MECGCTLTPYEPENKDWHWAIIYCPLHDSARLLLEALEKVKFGADCWCGSGSLHLNGCKIARTAILAAKGE